MEKNTAPIHGGVLISKEVGMTSHDVVAAIRHIPALKGIKVGHSGTLDPFATGTLLILLGHATRLQDELHLLPKTYVTTITLGAVSTTDDLTGEITSRENTPTPSQEEVTRAIHTISEQTTQIPPNFAAIKVAGKKLYEYARKGEDVVKKPRSITIHDITLEEYAYPTITLTITCSTGTYIRSIARDIGEILSTGGYCSQLQRTAIGTFDIQKSYKLNTLPTTITDAVIPIEQLVEHLESLSFTDENVAKLKNGREVEEIDTVPFHTPISLYTEDKRLFGIGVREENTSLIRPIKIFP